MKRGGDVLKKKNITVTCSLTPDIAGMLEDIRDYISRKYVEFNNISKSYAIKMAIKSYYNKYVANTK